MDNSKALIEAIRFLTVLPVPGSATTDEAGIARSMAAFPLVGLGIGALGAGAGWVAGALWGPELRSIVIVVAWMVLTAGLHLDGLADTCDALFSWRSREQKLVIMRDSRIGTMGALGLLAVVLLKLGALSSLGPWWWVGALLAPMWGRWADIYGIFHFPAAREGGMGRTFHEQVRRSDYVVATGSAALLGAVVALPWGALVVVVLWPLVHWLASRMARALGGLTGDTYGALSEVAEAVVLLALAAAY